MAQPLQQGVKYTGKICNNEIEMYLNFDGNQINGSYFYKSQNKPIQLKGKFDGGMGRDALSGFLFEESVNGEKTGEFNTLSPEGVILVSDYPNRVNQIKGTWINAKTGAKLPFEVRRVVVIAQSSSSQGQTGENFEDILKYTTSRQGFSIFDSKTAKYSIENEKAEIFNKFYNDIANSY